MLRSTAQHPELAGRRSLTTEQLRTMALNAVVPITAGAASEYQHYVDVRDELRKSQSSRPPALMQHDVETAERDDLEVKSASAMGEAAESAGAGAAAVAVVLAPVLAGTATAIFLLVGYLLRILNPETGIARPLITTGWLFGVITAVSILVAAVALLLTTLRNGSNPPQAEGSREYDEEVEQAKEAWQGALVEHGIMPFLRAALADPVTAGSGSRRISRTAQLGYSRPGFSSPDDGPAAGSRPRYSTPSTPEFTSPDFGGPTAPAPSVETEPSD
ncbi:hypothetical protein QFZ75_001684 [Streptomyces sp. V3I8]|uniref:hypothetical protein n=1 Tax=Streptomyces sp. V3I8 TaxID=3042279 RepID=UPI0027880BF4|nr:hypothetical protein [Streptomyces sp. V3I8]MDQ1035268.1 hypothetical protein [Streptomyces sp. V3I8]